jgi:hypothetical protein
MSNKLQALNNNLPTIAAPQTAFHNTAENVMQILNQGTINMYPANDNGSLYNAATRISTEYYNLFVVGNESFAENSFLIGKECSLTMDEGVSPEISARFASLSEDAKAEIKTFPSIFASINHKYAHTDDAHNAILGIVTDVKVMENGIRIHIHKACYIPQQRLNEIASEIGLHVASMANELCRTHWAIKRLNLIEKLEAAGLNVQNRF